MLDNKDIKIENRENKVEFSEKEKEVLLGLKERTLDLYSLKLSENFKKNSEVQKLALEWIKDIVVEKKIWKMREIQKVFLIPKEKLKTPEIQDATFRFVRDYVKDGYISGAQEVSKLFLTSKDKIKEAVIEGVICGLKSGTVIKPKEVEKDFPFFKDLVGASEIQDAAFEELKRKLHEGFFFQIKGLLELFPISQEKLKTPEIEELVSGAINRYLKNSSFYEKAKELYDLIPIPKDKLYKALSVSIKNILKYSRDGFDDRVKEVWKISNLFSIPEPENVLDDAISNTIEHFALKQNYGAAGEIYKEFPISKDKLNNALSNAIEKIVEKDEDSYTFFYRILKIHNEFPDSNINFNSENIYNYISEAVKNMLTRYDNDNILEVKQFLDWLPEAKEKMKKIAIESIKYRIERENIDNVIKIIDIFKISKEELLSDKEIIENSYKCILDFFEKGDFDGVIKIKENFLITQEKINQAVLERILVSLKNNNFNQVLELKEKINFEEKEVNELLLKEIPNGVLSNLIDISKENFIEVFGEIIPEDKINQNLTYIENVQNYVLQQNEFENTEDPEKTKEEFENLNEEEKYKKIFEHLSQLKNTVWDPEGERSDIANEFLLGVEKFGYKKMFEFIQDHNRHDALFAFDKIIALQEKSGLSEDDFYGKILFQVAKDSSVDENNRDSYTKLNDIAQKFAEKDMNSLVGEIEALDISSANKLLEKIKNEDGGYNFYQNWKILQKVSDFEQILAKKEVLEKIKNLPEVHQNFYEKLIFHPNIDTSAVIQMIEDPEGFLSRDDGHSNDTLHEFSKAANYYKADYSDLTAREVIDMLIDGKLDKIQKIPAFEMEFKIPAKEDLRILTIRQLLRKAIGIRGEGAEAKRPKKIFQEVNNLIEQYNEDNKTEFKLNKEFIDNKDDLENEIPEELEKKIGDILLNEENGFESKIIRFASLAKSDPDGIIAGTETASCDAWGSGKKTTYTFNPNIGQIVIQEERDENWKTLSQATVTLDYKIDKNIAEVVDEIKYNEGNISEILSENILEQKEKVLSLDSIEGETNEFLKSIWKNGVFALTKEMAKKENISTTGFIQGSYQGLVLGEKNIENNFIPTTVMGYSDNVKSETNGIFGIGRVVYGEIIKGVEDEKDGIEELPKGVSVLDSSSAFPVAYLEGKAYQDTELQEFLFDISNTLIYADYKNAAGTPKMSFKYEKNGKMEGYIVAYEGKIEDEYDPEEENQKFIYINDLAAIPESKMAGGKLIQAFVEQYMKKYIEKDNMMPIATRARDKTSYKIILKQLDKIGEKYNIEFKMKEINEYNSGNDKTHELVIYPSDKK